jgi:hypothetical protein
VLLRDYLQSEPIARRQYHAARRHAAPDEIAAAKQRLLPELLADAHRWWIARSDFGPVKAVERELADVDHSWFISSGWAIDLFLGRVTRYHHDVDVAVPRAAQLALQRHMAQRGWRWVTPLDGQLEPWPSGQFLELPRHQAHAHRTGEFIDFLLTDFHNGCWIYRRDPRIVRTAVDAFMQGRNGIRYLAPELVLLFKSKNTGDQARPQDQADFENVAPLLDAERRTWLRRALTTVDPKHPWLAQL